MSSFKNYKKTMVLDFDYEAVKDGIPKANQQMALLNSEFRKQMEVAKSTGDVIGKLGLKQEYLSNKVKIQADVVNALTKEIEEANSKEEKNEKALIRKTIKLNDAERELIKYEKQLKNVNLELEGHSGRISQAANQFLIYNETLKESGLDLDEFANKGAKVGAVITGINIAALKMNGDLDQIMGKTNTIADTTQVSLKELKKGVIDVSKVYNIHVNDVAEGLYNINSGNIATADSLKLLKDAAILAKAGFTDMETSTKLLTQIINAYGLEVSDASDITDKLILMQKLGQVTVGEFGEGFGKLAGLAGKAKIPLEEVMGAISTMTAMGYEPAEAMTALSAVLTQIVKPSEQASKAAKKYGVELNLAAIESKGFAGWIEHVERKTKGSDAALTELFGSANAIKSMFVLAGNGANKFEQDILELGNSMGYADEAIEKLKNSSESFSSGMNAVKLALVEVGAALSPFLEILAFILELISNIPKPVLVLIAVGGTMLLMISMTIKATKSLAYSATFASKVFGLKMNPAMLKTLAIIMAVTTAISILIALITTLTGKAGEASALMDKMSSTSGNFAKGVNTRQGQINKNVQGSHASGIDRIAGNRVRVELHEDEEVLSKDDPRNQNNPNFQSGGDTYILNIDCDEIREVYQLLETFKKLKQTKRGGKVQYG